MSYQGALEDERGFTLFEVIATIVIMGIVFAIATSTWFGVAESRRVDSATNQLVADLRLAHTSATNRLEDWQVVLAADSSTYAIGPTDEAEVCPDDDPDDVYLCRNLNDGTYADEVVVDTTATITFEPEGSAVLGDPPPDPPLETLTVNVSPADGDPAYATHDIQINAATSRVQIDPVP